jgi:hypothetical protein
MSRYFIGTGVGLGLPDSRTPGLIFYFYFYYFIFIIFLK